MADTFLASKIHIPPLHGNLVNRTPLIRRLNEGVGNSRLTIISAPAGYGKSTLLREWVSQIDTPVAWLSLEKDDNDPGRFWSYMLAALQIVQSDFGRENIDTLFASQDFQVDSFLIALVNEIAARSDPLVLVLDDYHVIDSASIQEGMIFLLEHMPGQMHLVVASRADPAWPLAHWRSHSELVEIRVADLRFTIQEAADFLNRTMKLDLSARDIAALEERTEGWIAGLQMAALSLQGREDMEEFIEAFTGSNRYIFDFLVEEVIERQPAEIKDFLLKTSVLARLSSPLCDVVLDRSDSREVLQRLEKASMFLIPLDDERRWYRYHHLFADLLSASLEQTDPGIVPTLHLRASEWYENHGFLSNAMTHALSAGDLDRLARLVEHYAFTIMNVKEASFFLNWLGSLPDHITNTYPWLNIARAWLLAYLGRTNRIESAIRAAEASASPEDKRIRGYIAAMRTLASELGTARIDDGILQAKQALDLLPRDDLRPRAFVCYHLANLLSWNGKMSEAQQALEDSASLGLSAGDIEMAMTAQFEIAALLRSQGKLHKSLQMYEDTLRMANTINPDFINKSLSVGYAYLCMAIIYLEWNDLEKSIDFTQAGLQICKMWGYSDYLLNGYIIYSTILYETGDLEGALNAIHEAKSIFPGSLPFDRVHSLEAIILLARGDLKSAENWIKQSGLSSEQIPEISHRAELLHFAKILVAQGKLDKAYRILEGLRNTAEQVGSGDLLLKILTQQAIISQDQGKYEQALGLIQHALGVAEPEGYIRVFLNKGAGMEQLLLQAISAGIYRDYSKKLLEKFQGSAGTSPAVNLQTGTTAEMKVHQALDESLSERELEILRLLESSMNTPEIARELYISVGTVRTHIKNIYRKLDVNRRMEAIQRAREVGLI